jgi:putative transposase
MDRERRTRRLLRLPGFDYSQAGAYFITICCYRRRCMLGEILDYKMDANELGTLVSDSWKKLPDSYPFVSLDSWTLMPNHLHGIVWLGEKNPLKINVSSILCAFKSMSTRLSWRLLERDHKLWQRGFFEHVIRDDADLYRIREYIQFNPINWAVDCENPSSTSSV